MENCRRKMEELSSKLSTDMYQHTFIQVDITKLEDWYNVTSLEVMQAGGRGLFQRHRSLYKLLSTVYPEYL